MKIALLGSRGIPARYSGFETFYEELAARLAQRGHAVTVYNRAHFIKDVRKEYKGVRIVSLPCIPTKHLETFTHTFLSTVHALFHGYDIVYYCIVGNSPLVWPPRLVGAKTFLNVDGSDWAREKWTGFARWYQHRCERIATRTPNILISDAHGVRDKYMAEYGADSVFVPYGANLRRDDRLAELEKWNLKPDEYILFVGRLVPENAAHLLIDAFKRVRTSQKLVIVGDAPYSSRYKQQLYRMADERVVFTGYAFGPDYEQLSTHAYLYVLPSGVEGTRPALLDQMGFGNCVLVRDSSVNMEVIGDCGCSFDKHRMPESLTEKLADLISSPETVQQFRGKAGSRISNYYNWDWIADCYEQLFFSVIKGENPVSYDEYLNQKTLPLDATHCIYTTLM